jgi:hypothetical protein
MGRRTALCACGLIAAASAFVPRAGVASPAFYVLVNQRNPVASLSASDVSRVINGHIKVWTGGGVILLGIIPRDAPETQYLASLLDSSAGELLSLIQQQVFKGELRRPVVLQSSGDCGAFARSDPGGICVESASVPVPEGARVVPIK